MRCFECLDIGRSVSRNARRRASVRRHWQSHLQLEMLEARQLLTDVSGVVWHDADGNGLRAPSEPGVAGAVVELFDTIDGIVGNGNDLSIAVRITDEAGSYCFADLVDLGQHYLNFRPPAGLTFTVPNAGGDELADSDADLLGASEVFAIVAAGDAVNLDAGLVGSAAPFGFAFPLGAGLDDTGTEVVRDPDGNLALTGEFYGTVDFDPGPGTVSKTSAGDRDAFLATYTPAGALVWVRTVGGPLLDLFGGDVLFDNAGKIHLTGVFQGTADLDPGPGEFNLTSLGGWDIFLLTLDRQGHFLSAQQMGSANPLRYEWIGGSVLDSQGNLYVAGRLEGTIDVDPGPGVWELTASGVSDAFFFKMDPAGELVWATRIGDVGWDEGNSITLDHAGNLWATGYYVGPTDFDPGPESFVLDTYQPGELDAFVLKLDPDGNFLWAGAMGGTSQDLGHDILVDHGGNVLVALNFRYAADVDPGPGVYQVIGAVTEDVAVVKLDPQGTLIWARVMAGSHRDRPYALAVDTADNVYTVGVFRRTVDFDPGPGEFVLNTGERFDCFLSKLDASGNFVFARQLGDLNYEDYGLSVAVDDRGNIYSTGMFNGTVDFDPGSGTYLASSAGGYDGFLWRMSQASLEGTVWQDLNGDGVRSRDEPGLAGAVVEVWSTADAVAGNSDDVSRGLLSTDDSGHYEFTGLADGVDYYVTVRVPAGLNFTAQQAGTGEEMASDVDATGRSNIYPLGSGETATLNAGVTGTVPKFGFAFSAGGEDADAAEQVARDAAGNIYIAGVFSGTSADVDPGPDTRWFQSAGNHDVLVAKYTVDGVLLWARSFGGPGEDSISGLDLDARGNLYVSGSFRDTTNFDTGWGSRTETSAGEQDAYVVRLDEYGNLVWVRVIGGPGEDVASDVCIDPTGNVLISGWFAETVDLDPGPGTNTATAGGIADGFVVKLSAAGYTLWSRALEGTGDELPEALATDSAGFVHVAGSFTDTADFDPGPDAAPLVSLGGQDSFLVRLTPDGEFVWARSIAGVDDQQATGLSVDAAANSYLVGNFRGAADLNPGPGVNQVSSAGAEDVFVVKLDASGAMVYGGRIGGPGTDLAWAVDVDQYGIVALAGAFSETADFDPSSSSFPLTSAGDLDAFVVRLAADGTFVFARSWGGSGVEEARDMALDASAGITTVGRFAHPTGAAPDFDPGPGTYLLEESGATESGDWFLSHLGFRPLRVTTTSDSGVGSLREAIHIANAIPGLDRIEFDLAGESPHSIQLTSRLPSILDAVTIDGTTQYGYVGKPLVELRGDAAGSNVSGLTIQAADTAITGLAINRFSGNGIAISGDATTGVVITGNYIGTDVTGAVAMGNAGSGIRLDGSANTVIGGTTEADRNVVAASGGYGIWIRDFSSNTSIQGNFLGTDASGTLRTGAAGVPFGNSSSTIYVENAADTTIGGLEPGAGNVISGSRAGSGIYLRGDSPRTLIQGNLIGTDITGTLDLGNIYDGILVGYAYDTTFPSATRIGGTTAGARNIISANGRYGIVVAGGGGSTVEGNYIGTDVTGSQERGNGLHGVYVANSADNLIGGNVPGSGNLISGNVGCGIAVEGSPSANNLIQGNYIGTDKDGNYAIANQGSGVLTGARAHHSIIGTDGDGTNDAFEGNIISGNQDPVTPYTYGLGLGDFDIVAGNKIGTDVTGTRAIPNATGIAVGSAGNRIGTNADGVSDELERNIIAGNLYQGLAFNYGAADNVVAGNYIGLGVNGEPLGNWLGVELANAHDNRIGTNADGVRDDVERNVISANRDYGIWLRGAGPDTDITGNVIAGNYIGTGIDGTTDLGNATHGIAATHRSRGAIIGGASPSARNVIAGNESLGVLIADSTDHQVLGNYIGVDRTGRTALPNAQGGVHIYSYYYYGLDGILTTGNVIGGTAPGAGNVISGNGAYGVDVSGVFATDNFVQGNLIGTDATGAAAVPNAVGVVMADSEENTLGGADPAAGNIVAYNNGPGIHLLDRYAAAGEVRNNRVFGNLGYGILLGSGPGPLLNDPGDTDGFLNFPVLVSAQVADGQLTVEGFARPNAVIDLYLSTPTADGFGQGQVLLATLIEGSAADTDPGTGSYGPGPVNGHIVGSDTTNLFSFTIPLPDDVNVGSLVTAVAIGSTSSFSPVVSVGDLPPNVAPEVFAGDELVELVQGEPLERSGYFVDDDSVSWTATVIYGDGSVEPLSLRADRTFDLRHEYAAAGSYSVTVTIVDNSLAVGQDSFTVSIQNEAPSATFNVFTITSPASEGSTVTLRGEFNDPGMLDIHTVDIDWGDNSPHTLQAIPQGDRSFSATHVYIDDSPSNTARDVYRVQVTVDDDKGGADTTPLGIYLEDVFNVAPRNVSLELSSSEIEENEQVFLSGSFADPGVLDTHVVTIDWGDGSPATIVELGANVLSFADIPHIYRDDPDNESERYVITVEVVDDDEPLAPTSTTAELRVRNVAPQDVQVYTDATEIQEDGVVTLGGSFFDPGPTDAHRVEIDWGDGSEPAVLELAPEVNSFTDITHRYADDSGAGSFVITARVTDEDAPLDVSDGTTSVKVINAAPVVESLLVSDYGPIDEGTLITVSGTYSDVGLRDRHTVEVYWGAERLGLASVDSTNHSYTFTHLLDDDNPSGTPSDAGPIEVHVVDDEGGVGTSVSVSDLRVNNVAPQVTILPGDGSTELAVQLIALVRDPGLNDTFVYRWTVTRGGVSYGTVEGGPTFTLDRSGAPDAVYVVTLSVTDDDTGTGVLSTAVLLGTSQADNIVVTDSAFAGAGVNNLLVLGLGEADVIDATQVSAGNNVVLDGGDSSDYLFGGSGDDIIFLRGGDDNANVAFSGGPQPSFNGDDRYYVVPNSTHTVVDTLGENALDFAFSPFGVTFDLSVEDTPQDVDPLGASGEHFVEVSGTFSELVGSEFGDVLTGASGATVLARQGADQLYVKGGMGNVFFFGGDQDDVLTATGRDIGTVFFGGDDGADQLINQGSLLALVFTGGSDADTLINTSTASILGGLDFRGDDGADQLINHGSLTSLIFTGGADSDTLINTSTASILGGLDFRGDDGADQLINEGSLTSLVFTGGSDADTLINAASGSILSTLDFRGDDGADQLINEGSLLALIFTGGSDSDTLINTAGSILSTLDFRGDDGADQLINEGSLFALVFTGGADADTLINAASGSILSTLDFRGDDGADQLINQGSLTSLIFTGGADSDTLINTAGSILSTLDFRGDDGADQLINEGSLFALIFTGGSDADTLINTAGSILNTLDFRGDDGADQLINQGSLTSLIFTGGADADTLINTAGSILNTLDFRGDDGADQLINQGSLMSLVFTGGADADTLLNQGSLLALVFTGGSDADTLINTATGSILGGLDFRGDDGADTLINNGVLLALVFSGGSDADTLINTATGSILESLDFRGDGGDDVLLTVGVVETMTFTGGAGSDRFKNSAPGVVSLTVYGGSTPDMPLPETDGDDIFVNVGNDIGAIFFHGGDGDDVAQNNGGSVGLLDLQGDAGQDTFVNYGNNVALQVAGGAGADAFINLGHGITRLEFVGDEVGATEGGADTLLNYGNGLGTDTGAYIAFHGGDDIDAFQNDGTGFVRVGFWGAEGNDAFKNNAVNLPQLTFDAGPGDDVFENNGDRVGQLTFAGGTGSNIFVNDGGYTASLNYEGGLERDVLILNGIALSNLAFRGYGDADVLVINGHDARNVLFEGGDGDDLLVLSSWRASDVVFDAGLDDDRLLVLDTAGDVHDVQFLAGDGDDLLENASGQLNRVYMSAGPGDDVFRNASSGTQLSNVTIEGGDGLDIVENQADAVGVLLFDGGASDDALVNRGAAFGSLTFLGGSGDDNLINVGSHGTALLFTAGDGNDAFTNSGNAIQLLELHGDAGHDRYQNNGDDIESLLFHGGPGNDALQQNGQRLANLMFYGEEDEDTLLLNGSHGAQAIFDGGTGADAWIMTGGDWQQLEFYGGEAADVLRVEGNAIGSTLFHGNAGSDSFVYRGCASVGSQVNFLAGSGTDIFAFLGSVETTTFAGETGDDYVLVAGSGQFSLSGGEGDDEYAFAGALSSRVTIAELYSGEEDTSRDTLDFSAFAGGPLHLDLALTVPQFVGTGLELTLVDANGIENIIGTSLADIVDGNDRDNWLAGADFAPELAYPTAARSDATQWVLLDFTSDNDAGEHFYTSEERAEIEARIERSYHGPDADTENPWFNVQVTQSVEDIPSELDYVTIYFNRTPSFDRPGGESSEVEFRNLNQNGYAVVQVNGLLGGIETVPSADEDFLLQRPEDQELPVGQYKPAGTDENFVLLAAKIAAHELGHLMGLRHYDSYGPIGFGLHAPPGGSAYKPVYAGPAAAFETCDHLIGSPASIGSDRFNDLGDLFFGEREAIKLTMATSDQAALVHAEAASLHGDLATAQTFPLVALQVPNTLGRGFYSSKQYLVAGGVVSGTIDLDDGTSESDFYWFDGRQGELVNIEVISQALTRLGPDLIDSVLRVWTSDGQLVPYYDSVAENDDEFETTDSTLIDLRLPADGRYYIEVDTFRREPSSPSCDASLWDGLSEDAIARLCDACHDTDTGRYELVVYTFEAANSADAIDTLRGRGGNDQLEGGPGESYGVELVLGDELSLNEGELFTQDVTFVDRGGMSWSATIDYGDSSSPATLQIAECGHFELSHTYLDNGSYTITVELANDDGLSDQQSVMATVWNQAPVIHSITAPLDPRPILTEITALATFTEFGILDTHDAAWNWGDSTTSVGVVSEASGSGQVSGTHIYTMPGVYTVGLAVTDDDGATTLHTYQYVVVYSPSGGFVSGGGSLVSPAGAYVADPLVTGSATWGFVVRYRSGSDRPEGHAMFRLHDADLRFQATAYEWLVVSGPYARCKGAGTINGEGQYQFVIVVTDAAVDGGGEEDLFRLKIWDGQTGSVVYDNQPGAALDSSAGTALRGGNIIIHTGGSNLLASSGAQPAATNLRLTEEQLSPAVGAAIRYWERTGFTPAQIEQLRSVEVILADFSDTRLGHASWSTNIVWIDVDAAGYGWRLVAGTPAAGQSGLDLLTIVTHELGHMLGLADLDPRFAAGHVMAGVLSVDGLSLDQYCASPAGWATTTITDQQDKGADWIAPDDRAALSESVDGSVGAATSPIIVLQDRNAELHIRRVTLPDARRQKAAEMWDEDWLGLEDSLLDTLAVERDRVPQWPRH